MDVLKTKCAAHNVVLGRLETCSQCLSAKRASAHRQGDGEKIRKAAGEPFAFRAAYDGHVPPSAWPRPSTRTIGDEPIILVWPRRGSQSVIVPRRDRSHVRVYYAVSGQPVHATVYVRRAIAAGDLLTIDPYAYTP